MKEVDYGEVFKIIKPRPINANKGNFGRLFIISGSKFYRGCAYLATMGALRSGIGICTLASTECVINSVSARVAECTYYPLEENEYGCISSENLNIIYSPLEKCTAGLIGCGMGINPDTTYFIREFIRNAEIPLVLDADALNSIKGMPEILCEAKYETIITPHTKEFSRLCGAEVENIEKEPEKYALEFAEKYNCTVILKSYRTVIASKNHEPVISKLGNVGLAKGGSGDMLAGIVSALRAQGYDAYQSAICAVFVHGTAANMCAREMSHTSMLPSDVLGYIDRVFKADGR